MKKILFGAMLMTSLGVLGQKQISSAPFELYGDHLFVKVSVDKSDPLDFIFDTGAGITVVDLEVAKSLNLDLHGDNAVAGAQGYVHGAKIKHKSVEISDIKLKSHLNMEAFDLQHLSISIGRKVQGIIGYDLLHQYAVKINYDNMQMEFYSHDDIPKVGKKIHFKLHNAIPVIEGNVTFLNDQNVEASFYVNTGAGTTLDFNSPFAKDKKVLKKTGDHYSYYVKGVGDKETQHFEGRLKVLDLVFDQFENLPVGISQVKSGLQGDKKVSGIVGNRVLSRYNILFDYKNHRMFVEPNAKVEETFTVNCSGLDVQMNKAMDKVLIHQVQEGGPAMEAGILLDDEILSINDKSVSELTLIEIENILKQAGTTVKLELSRNGETKVVSLDLKELL